MVNWLDGNQMTSRHRIIVALIMLLVWGVFVVAAVSVWRGSSKRTRPEPGPKSEDQRL